MTNIIQQSSDLSTVWRIKIKKQSSEFLILAIFFFAKNTAGLFFLDAKAQYMRLYMNL